MKNEHWASSIAVPPMDGARKFQTKYWCRYNEAFSQKKCKF